MGSKVSCSIYFQILLAENTKMSKRKLILSKSNGMVQREKARCGEEDRECRGCKTCRDAIHRVLYLSVLCVL
ncbi:MAG: hypothetical protein V7K21_03340 [Nostoc sp.]|uniref:hypothetical protein n=1 Tax=Nostoc sp. TaxID=1180 RepID=UPI002FFC71FA